MNDRQPILLADKNGAELFVGDTVRIQVAEAFREFGLHGDWAEYEITTAPGGFAIKYLRSEKGAVLPYGYLGSYVTEIEREELPALKDMLFARTTVRHRALLKVKDDTTKEERHGAFLKRANANIKEE